MTIETQSASATYQGDGSNRDFSIPYRVDSLTHLRVYVTNRATTIPTVTQVSSSDYEVTGDFTLGSATLKYPKTTSSLSPISSNKHLTIERVIPLVQDVNFLTASGYFMEDLENMADGVIQKVQQINERVQRAVTVPIGSGLDPDDYLTLIGEAVEQAEAAAQLAQDSVTDAPAMLYKEVFGIGGTSPFAITQAHNGNLAVATVGAGGLVVNLPQMSTLSFPYQVALKRKSGSATFTINAYSGDTIEGNTSITMSTNGEVIVFVADDDTLAGTWTVDSHGSGSYATGSVNSSMLADDAVTTAKVATGAITADEIGTGAVTNTKLGANSVTSGKIAAGNVTQSHFDAALLTKIAGIPFQETSVLSSNTTLTETHKGYVIKADTGSGNVTITLPAITSVTSPYAVIVQRSTTGNTVTVARSTTDTINGATSYTLTSTQWNAALFIADFTGATANTWAAFPLGSDASIADGVISTAKIADLAVTAAKLASDAVTTAKILDANVTTAKIADGNITTVKVADGNITAAKLASDAVTTAKILDANVTTNKIADANVTTNKLADSSVTNAKINSSAVTAIKISTGAVETDKIADLAVTTAKIANNAVGLTQLSATVNSYISCIPFGDVQSISSTSTLTGSQKGYILNLTASSAITLTLPLISGETAPLWYVIRRASGTARVTITANAANKINGGADGGSVDETNLGLSTTVGSWVWVIADFSGGTSGQWVTLP